MIQHSKSTINIGDKVRIEEETEYSEVVNTLDNFFQVVYPDGNAYDIEYDMIEDVKPGPGPGAPAPALPNTKVSIPQSVIDHAKNVQKDLKIGPGVIVTYAKSTAHGQMKDRLWVVLNWTKGSNNLKVNIAPVNGDPAKSWEWVAAEVSKCTPVKFGSLVHGRAFK